MLWDPDLFGDPGSVCLRFSPSLSLSPSAPLPSSRSLLKNKKSQENLKNNDLVVCYELNGVPSRPQIHDIEVLTSKVTLLDTGPFGGKVKLHHKGDVRVLIQQD